MAVSGDANGDQHGTIDQVSAFPDPFIAGIEENIRRLAKGALPLTIYQFGTGCQGGGSGRQA